MHGRSSLMESLVWLKRKRWREDEREEKREEMKEDQEKMKRDKDERKIFFL